MEPHPPVDLNDFRRVLGHYATGVAIVTAINAGRPVGMTVQSLSSLSLSPPLVLFCPSKASTSWPAIAAADGLCINVLADHQEDLARLFARSGGDKFEDVAWEPSEVTRSPALPEALAWLDCHVARVHEEGDHYIVVCDVRTLRASADRSALVFFRSEFRKVMD